MPVSNKTSNKKLPAARNRNSKGIRIRISTSAESNILRCFGAIMSQHIISVDYVLVAKVIPPVSLCTIVSPPVVSKEYSEYTSRMLFNMLYFIIIHVLRSYFFLRFNSHITLHFIERKKMYNFIFISHY